MAKLRRKPRHRREPACAKCGERTDELFAFGFVPASATEQERAWLGDGVCDPCATELIGDYLDAMLAWHSSDTGTG